jgi:hypothetical protein
MLTRQTNKNVGVITQIIYDFEQFRTEIYQDIDTFCDRTPKSILARHYADYSPERLKNL